MAQIMGSESINGAIPKIIELPYDLILNGHVYDKKNLFAKTFNFLPFNDVVTSYLDPIMNEVCFTKPGIYSANSKSSNCIVVDNSNPDICYVINSFNSINNYLFKIDMSDEKYQLQNTKLVTNSYYANLSTGASIIDQDNKNIYVLCNLSSYNHSSYLINTIFTIDKNNLSVTTTNLSSRGRLKILKCTDLFIYYFSILDQVYISRFNKQSKTNELIKTFPLNVGAAEIKIPLSFVKEENDEIIFYQIVDKLENGNHIPKIWKYNLNLYNNHIYKEEMNLNCSQNDKFTFDNILSKPLCFNMECIYKTINEEEYISLIPFAFEKLDVPDELNYIFTFKKVDQNNFNLFKKQKLNASYKTLLFLNSNMFILGNSNLLTAYKFDVTNFDFNITSKYQNNIDFICKDLNNNIWIQNSDFSIESFSLTLPNEIYCEFEQDEYYYEGSDINTNIVLYAKSFTGEYIQSNLKLKLLGDCKFAINNTKEINISTSKDSKVYVPVIINGPSLLEIQSVLI